VRQEVLVAASNLLVVMRKNILRTTPSCVAGRAKIWKPYHGVAGTADFRLLVRENISPYFFSQLESEFLLLVTKS
jgi:hypothetical protein